MGITATILSRCLEVISLNIITIISVTLTIPCIWPCHSNGAHVLWTSCKMEFVSSNRVFQKHKLVKLSDRPGESHQQEMSQKGK